MHERPPSPQQPEGQESQEKEPLTTFVYAQDVTTTDEETKAAVSKTFYRWEGQLWQKQGDVYTPGAEGSNVRPDIESLAGQLRYMHDAHNNLQRSQQQLAPYRIALSPSETIKHQREAALRQATNVRQATIRALNKKESEDFRRAYRGEQKRESPQPLKPALQSPPGATPALLVRKPSQPEATSAELTSRLQESAQVARQTPEQAMMTPELRNLLSDIRTNDPIYLHFRWLGGEHPLGFEEFGTTGNEVALRLAQGEWRNVNLAALGSPAPDQFLGFKYRGQPNSHTDPGYNAEIVGINPSRQRGYSHVSYSYTANSMLSGTAGRGRCIMKVDVILPQGKAEQLFTSLEQQPDYARQFFIAASLDTKGNEHLWHSQPERRPSYSHTPELFFYDHRSEQLNVSLKQKQGGKWIEAPLPGEVPDLVAEMQKDVAWEKWQREEAQRPPPPPPKKKGWFGRLLDGDWL